MNQSLPDYVTVDLHSDFEQLYLNVRKECWDGMVDIIESDAVNAALKNLEEEQNGFNWIGYGTVAMPKFIHLYPEYYRDANNSLSQEGLSAFEHYNRLVTAITAKLKACSCLIQNDGTIAMVPFMFRHIKLGICVLQKISAFRGTVKMG